MTRTLLVAAGLLSASAEIASVALPEQAQSFVTTLIGQRQRATVCVQVSPNSCVAMKSETAPAGACSPEAERNGCADGFVAVAVTDGRRP